MEVKVYFHQFDSRCSDHCSIAFISREFGVLEYLEGSDRPLRFEDKGDMIINTWGNQRDPDKAFKTNSTWTFLGYL